MKTKSMISIIPFVLLFMLVNSCQDKVVEKYTTGVPVYMSYGEMRSAVKTSAPVSLQKPGKIYFKDNYIYINEYFKGIHVIDNSNPSSPQEKKFIEVPGNVDIAIKDNTLFADSYVDLVALDISDLNNITEKHRVLNVFPYTIPENPVKYSEEVIDPSKGVVVSWNVKEITKDVKPQQYPGPILYDFYRYDGVAQANFAGAKQGSSGSTSSVGVGGSMARFAILDNALYVLTTYQLNVIDITDINLPSIKTSVNNYSGIETIFLNQGYMYLGARNGMSIYDTSDPMNPQFISAFTHFTSCDPVVVEGNYAFVTLRAGVPCRSTITPQLDVIDISNKTQPTLLNSYIFTEPHGLGIENSTLFLCDGSDGLKVFDASDVLHITQHQLAEFKNIQATDVIPVQGLLFMIGDGGFYQYDYSNLQDIKFLSKIEVKN